MLVLRRQCATEVKAQGLVRARVGGVREPRHVPLTVMEVVGLNFYQGSRRNNRSRRHEQFGKGYGREISKHIAGVVEFENIVEESFACGDGNSHEMEGLAATGLRCA